jgi:hypothetical protein
MGQDGFARIHLMTGIKIWNDSNLIGKHPLPTTLTERSEVICSASWSTSDDISTGRSSGIDREWVRYAWMEVLSRYGLAAGFLPRRCVRPAPT